jgi:hypothetical protein
VFPVPIIGPDAVPFTDEESVQGTGEINMHVSVPPIAVGVT